jgi:hypothetical protein
MSEDSRYGVYRGLFMIFCVLFIGVGIFRSCSNVIHPPQPQAIVAEGFDQRFCEEPEFDKTYDYNKGKMPEKITITLHTGCYANHYIMPARWESFWIQKSRNVGDWASVWCEGRPTPGPVRPYTTDMGGSMVNCGPPGQGATFAIQGRGTITFRGTQIKPGPPGSKDPETDAASTPTYKLIQMLPTSGVNDHYTLVRVYSRIRW